VILLPPSLEVIHRNAPDVIKVFHYIPISFFYQAVVLSIPLACKRSMKEGSVGITPYV